MFLGVELLSIFCQHAHLFPNPNRTMITTMPISTKFKQQLKAKAHKLNPIVFIGNKGLTDNIKTEVDRALTDHELIKIRIQESDRAQRHELFQEICQTARAEAIQMIGGIGIIYRKNIE